MLYGRRIFKSRILRKEEVEKWVAGSTYKGAVPLRLCHQVLLVEIPVSKFENITCLKGCKKEGF